MNKPLLTDQQVQSIGGAAICTMRSEVYDVLVARGMLTPQQASALVSSICRRSFEAFEKTRAEDFR